MLGTGRSPMQFWGIGEERGELSPLRKTKLAHPIEGNSARMTKNTPFFYKKLPIFPLAIDFTLKLYYNNSNCRESFTGKIPDGTPKDGAASVRRLDCEEKFRKIRGNILRFLCSDIVSQGNNAVLLVLNYLEE